jgi:hypothetical protein
MIYRHVNPVSRGVLYSMGIFGLSRFLSLAALGASAQSDLKQGINKDFCADRTRLAAKSALERAKVDYHDQSP